MLVIEYHSNDDVRVVELPVPEIGPGELLVQLRACGICASDVMEWYMRPRAPIYPGHEPVGILTSSCPLPGLPLLPARLILSVRNLPCHAPGSRRSGRIYSCSRPECAA